MHPLYDHARDCDIAFGWEPSLEVDFYLDLLSRYGSCPVRRILDVACGTGRLLLPMAVRGLSCVGVDAHAPLVEFALGRARASKLSLELRAADPRAFQVARPCDGAFSTLSAFRRLLTSDDVYEHFLAVSAALVPGAAYVVDVELLGGDFDPSRPPQTWSASRDGVTVETTRGATAAPDWGTRLLPEETRMRVTEAGRTEERVARDELRAWTIDDFRGHAWAGGFAAVAWFALPARVADPFRPAPWTQAETTARVLAVLRMR
ncbi:MAG: class I SAM-dependent methyltransferase [Planctomycetes bacterium]|nr:class I SAM-dependent methyltransferase [Planctomycetota bacterium]